MDQVGTDGVPNRDPGTWRDREARRDREVWKDRLITAILCFGAGLTLAWCAVIAGSTWWLVERIGF